MTGMCESADGRSYAVIEPMSTLQDLEAGLRVEGSHVNGLDEAFELPHAEVGLSGSRS